MIKRRRERERGRRGFSVEKTQKFLLGIKHKVVFQVHLPDRVLYLQKSKLKIRGRSFFWESNTK
jgi:hypothetical protein